MIKRELIETVAGQTKMMKSEVEAVIDATFDAIVEKLIEGDRVIIRNFGIFSVEEKKAKKGYDFKNKCSIDVPKSYHPEFRFCKDIKQDVNCVNFNRMRKYGQE